MMVGGWQLVVMCWLVRLVAYEMCSVSIDWGRPWLLKCSQQLCGGELIASGITHAQCYPGDHIHSFCEIAHLKCVEPGMWSRLCQVHTNIRRSVLSEAEQL